MVFVGRFVHKGSWISEAWRNEHQEELPNKLDSPLERIVPAKERRETLNIDLDGGNAVCAVFGNATSIRRSAVIHTNGNQQPEKWADQLANTIELIGWETEKAKNE